MTKTKYDVRASEFPQSDEQVPKEYRTGDLEVVLAEDYQDSFYQQGETQ